MNRFVLPLVLALIAAPSALAQLAPTDDPVLQEMWDQGMTERSQAPRLAQVLLDSIGPRLMGTSGYNSAVDWALAQYAAWDIDARREQYGTWNGWRRGATNLELIVPRRRDLDVTLMAYSPGTDTTVVGEVVEFPDLPDGAAYDAWLAEARGKFVLLNPPEPSCRPLENLIEHARPETVDRIQAQRDSIQAVWGQRVARSGGGLAVRLDRAGVAGVLTSSWSQGWGVNKIHSAATREVPMLDVSCEDNGLLTRLAENGQGPLVRLNADAEALGETPSYNVIAEISGSELPNEYILLSAHFDSWDGASGATDNGTATVMMLEAMRIVKATYPNPRRTILAGHWGGEEQGLIGSGAFAADNPEVVDNIHVGFNHDNGTWRVEAIRMQGFEQAQPVVERWLRRVPGEISDTIAFTSPQREGGSDHTSFTCHGAPVVRLQSNYPDYRQYTWHTNLDTYDKVILDDLKNNATLAAMLAYLASEEPSRLPRERRLRTNQAGEPEPYPPCRVPPRSSRR